jgi:hypothetical protein
MSDWIRLIVELGIAVYRAVDAGERDKTVGEILDGMGTDMAKVRALEEEAREHYET